MKGVLGMIQYHIIRVSYEYVDSATIVFHVHSRRLVTVPLSTLSTATRQLGISKTTIIAIILLLYNRTPIPPPKELLFLQICLPRASQE